MNTNNKEQNIDTNAIFNKLKNRIPGFIIGIYCLITTIIYDNNTDIKEIKQYNQDIYFFQVYYVFMCLITISWDLWHSIRAYSDNTILYNKIIFCLLSIIISLIIFIIATNMTTFGLPLRIFFNLDRDAIILIYGTLLPIAYFLNAIELVYWKQVVEKFNELEKEDDIEHNDLDLDLSFTKTSKTYQNINL